MIDFLQALALIVFGACCIFQFFQVKALEERIDYIEAKQTDDRLTNLFGQVKSQIRKGDADEPV